MKITKIEKQKKDETRYSIFLDDKFAFGLKGVDVLSFSLKEGDFLQAELYDKIINHIVYEDAKTVAFRSVSRSLKTEKEVRDKLALKDFNDEIIERVISLLKEYNYINDEEYVEKFINYRTKVKKHGLAKVKFELINKGISQKLIDNFLLDYEEEDKLELMLELINKKTKGEKNLDYKEKQKVVGYLSRRGFDFESIYIAIKHYETQI